MESISTFKSFFGLRQTHEKTIEKILEEYDAVIVRLPSELGFLTANVAKKMNKKCLTEVVGCAWDAMWNYGGIKSKVYAPFLFLKMRNSVKRSNYTTYVTKQFLQERYPSAENAKMIAVSDVNLTDSDENILSQRIKKIKNMNEKIIFGTIGSLSVQYKGIDIALNTLSKIANKYNNFEYHILGEGNSEKHRILLEKLGIADNVFFDGSLPSGQRVLNWLDSIDIYLQPSRQEGLPRALVEAMSRACPVVASSVGGIPELLDQDMMFSHDHPQKFYEIIETLIHDKKIMMEVSKRNFNEVKKYQKSVLDKKRNTFFMNFQEDVLKSID